MKRREEGGYPPLQKYRFGEQDKEQSYLDTAAENKGVTVRAMTEN